MVPKSLENCIAVIKTMRKTNMSYKDACDEVLRAKNDGVVLGTIRDSCTRFGKGGKNRLNVSEVEDQVQTGEIVNTLKREFPNHTDYIDSHLG